MAFQLKRGSVYNGQMLSGEVQLGYAVEAFGYAHKKGVGWATSLLLYLKHAGIDTISDLSTGCRDQTVNLDLELFGVPAENRLSEKTLQDLISFLPGPVGFRCFRLAQVISKKVERGGAETEYVHRPENGKFGEEEFNITVGDQWVVNVDCAGFVRNALKHVTKNPFVMALSDRDFMRAKDFYDFFSTIPLTVMSGHMEIPESARLMRWRIVPDLRMCIPGDIIVYRPKGNAAGGAAFTTNDRKDFNHILLAVKTAILWQDLRQTGALVTRNMAKDPQIKPWIKTMKEKLKDIGITTVKEMRQNIHTVNEKLKEKGHPVLDRRTLQYIEECCTTTASNTGHIVFAAGPAVELEDNEFRIRVVHSTKHGKLDENGNVITGVQEYFRRFKLIEGPYGEQIWTRPDDAVKKLKEAQLREQKAAGLSVDSDDDEGENPDDDMDEPEDLGLDDDDSTTPSTAPSSISNVETVGGDDCAGQDQIEVIAARMCF